jgi:hypothetical protein
VGTLTLTGVSLLIKISNATYSERLIRRTFQAQGGGCNGFMDFLSNKTTCLLLGFTCKSSMKLIQIERYHDWSLYYIIVNALSS